MTKSDDFIDITGTAAPSDAPAAGNPNEVDFDIFGSEEAPVDAVAKPTDFADTAMLPITSLPTDSVDFDVGGDDHAPGAASAAAAPLTPPSPTPASVSAEAAPASGGGKLWMGIAEAVIVALVVWWFMLR